VRKAGTACQGAKTAAILVPRGAGQQIGFTMKDDENKPEGPSRNLARNARQDRLKLALRENLKRRKSQARGRDEKLDASSGHADGSLDDASRKKPDA
jgi:hypothetical protein